MMRATTVLIGMAALLAGACASAPKPQPEPAAAAPVAEQVVEVPMSIVLEGDVDAEGRWALRATLTVSARISVPPVLRILLPPGAELVAGNLSESLPAPGVDAVHIRRFVVKGATEPVRVVAGAISGGAGFTVSARFPARDVMPRYVPPATQPIPPTKVGDVPVDQAVPLD